MSNYEKKFVLWLTGHDQKTLDRLYSAWRKTAKNHHYANLNRVPRCTTTTSVFEVPDYNSTPTFGGSTPPDDTTGS